MVVAALGRPVRAEPSERQIETARALFKEATVLRERGRFGEAAEKLKEAVEIKETPGLYFHLAHCYDEMGRLVEAARAYDRADELIRQGVKAPVVAKLLIPTRASLRERTPTISLQISVAERDVRATLDGGDVPANALRAALPLDPGTHRLVVTAPGRVPFTTDILLSEGDARIVQVVLAPVAPSPSPPPPAKGSVERRPPDSASKSDDGPDLRDAVLIGASAVTVGGLIVGTFFAVRNADAGRREAADVSAIGDSASACLGAPTSACEDLPAALTEQVNDRRFAIAGFVGAGIGAASLLTTALVWPAAPSSNGLKAEVGPLPGGLLVRGAF